MARYAEGDNAAFEEVYRDVAPRLRAFLLRRSPEQADDILQQTFLAIHRGRATFLPGAPVMPWAFAIARRRLIDSARSVGRAERLDTGPEPVVDRDAYSALQGKRLQAELEEELGEFPIP